jgi:hypothetical protein
MRDLWVIGNGQLKIENGEMRNRQLAINNK